VTGTKVHWLYTPVAWYIITADIGKHTIQSTLNGFGYITLQDI